MRQCILSGLGARGRYWIGEIQKRNDVEIAAFVDSSEPARLKAAEEFGIGKDKLFPDLGSALQNVPAQFVLDVTPPSVHHKVAAAAFDKGLHVLGEKPLSDDFATAQRVVDSGRRAGVKHMITQNYRFNPQVRSLRKFLEGNIIGRVGQCDVQFYKAWADQPGSHYVTEPYMVIKDMMVHHFDLMRYLLGQEPSWVQALTWNHSWGWHAGDAAHAIVFGFPQGLMATHVTVGCSVGYSPPDYNGSWRFSKRSCLFLVGNQS